MDIPSTGQKLSSFTEHEGIVEQKQHRVARPLFFTPIPFKTVWGGNAIREYFDYNWMPDSTGQAWAFADQPDGSSICETPPFAGMTLGHLWREHAYLFGDARQRNANQDFPLIISMLCPCADLSIQVHPDAERARRHGYSTGKNEAWYFLEAPCDANIVYGHNASTEEELRKLVKQGRWDGLLRHLAVRRDDYVYIPAGRLHACCHDVIVYEVQQATNVTYRFYDYDRIDASGKARPLHLEEAIACLDFDRQLDAEHYDASVEARDRWVRTTYHNGNSFRVDKIEVREGSYLLEEPTYELVSIVRGSGTVVAPDDPAHPVPIRTGSHFLVPSGISVTLSGKLTCMMATA